jgi:ribosomal protein S18 acetylase RimI-like enzyme
MSLRAMSLPEYERWLEATIPAYAADKVASGQWSQAESLARSKKEYDELLPQGRGTADNHFFTIVDAQSAAVGVLWFAVKTRFDARIAYVFDVAVQPERQREGHALRAFVALEDEVRRLGLSGIGLHVFGHNTGAHALYARLGFAATNISMFKPLSAAGVHAHPGRPDGLGG